MLLFADPRPLVERLGASFFRQAPERPGVYLMRDSSEVLLYVGKAKNLRKRLASYRVANPDRLGRRHLRLLRAVHRIELLECPDESAALAKESELLLSLRPRFNRAGTWPRQPRFLAWRFLEQALALAILPSSDAEWHCHGPVGSIAGAVRGALVRLLWSSIHNDRGLSQMPEGWIAGRFGQPALVPLRESGSPGAEPSPESKVIEALPQLLEDLFAGRPEPFVDCVRARTSSQTHACEVAVRELDLETVAAFF